MEIVFTEDMTTTIEITSNPVVAAGGLTMMAKHLAFGIDTATAHPEADTGRIFCDRCWDHRDEAIDSFSVFGTFTPPRYEQ